MARYELRYMDCYSGEICEKTEENAQQVVFDSVKNETKVPFELIDLLNAHDGMMTREHVERLIESKKKQQARAFYNSNKVLLHDLEIAEACYKYILNGGTK